MMGRTWNIYLIHHSHTDIGYTERQDKIARYHSDFICQAIDILNDIHEGKREDAKGFVWQCENHWQVKNFYEKAPEAYQKAFECYVKTGEIGLSGNYLNLTELVSEHVLTSRIRQARHYGERVGYPVRSAMCADINGMAWGYADALYENGVTRLYTCIHPHHGMFPLYQKMIPFYWESPKGNRLLVWNGDYYHLGNELFFAPHGGNTYQIRDEYHEPMNAHMILNKSAEDTEMTEWEICRTRLERYLENLEAEDYPYSFVPFMVSGCITDNAPPSAELAKRVNELNKAYNGRITFQMVNLDQFFDVLQEQQVTIPCYSGDINDWWADGTGSAPDAVMVYLDARRKDSLCRKLDTSGGDRLLAEETAENLILYAEHTWGYSSSVLEPWEPLVGNLEWKKAGYAVNANTAASKNLDQILAGLGEISICHEKGQRYRIINPHKTAVNTAARLYIELWEYIEGIRYSEAIPVQVIDCETGRILPSQVSSTARAYQIEVMADLPPGGKMDVKVIPDRSTRPVTTVNRAYMGAEGIADLLQDGLRKDSSCVETKGFRLCFSQSEGIISVYDKIREVELLRDDGARPPFSGVYEVTKGKEDAREIRRNMGRNRKSEKTRRYDSILTNLRIAGQGDVYTAIELDYEIEGCRFYQVCLKVYEDVQLIEAKVRIHKDSIWNPENLYIELPFTAGADGVTWIDKTGCMIRPGVDQLPGTNQDFYLLQNGVVWENDQSMLILSSRNAPLISMGDLQSGPVKLCDGGDMERNRSQVHSWVMNNYWETNFKAETGGFYEFTYHLRCEDKKSIEEAFLVCEAENEGLISMYVSAE